jgi:mRNA interferase HigB
MRRVAECFSAHNPRPGGVRPDFKGRYASASVYGNHRVVFNVGGNQYRLVVEVQYQAVIVWVKFVGTHAQYDRIDAESVNDY